MDDTLPVARQKPAAHGRHEDEELKDTPPPEKVPAPQGVPAAEPAGQKEPAGQGLACGVAPVQTKPAGQGFDVVVMLPASKQKPAVHATQDACEVKVVPPAEK